MYPIHFRKERAEYLLDCLATGKPIVPSQSLGWTIDDMMALAGACHFAAMSHGPCVSKAKRIDITKLPKEYQEATEMTFVSDLRAAVEFYSQLTMLVKDGEYDSHFEPYMVAVVTQTGDVRNSVAPLEGHKPDGGFQRTRQIVNITSSPCRRTENGPNDRNPWNLE